MSSVKATASGILETADSTGVMEVLSSGGFGLKVATDGRVYGDKLHNVGTITGTTDQFIASGTYTPTLTNTTNINASTAYTCQFIRVGNVGFVSGQVAIDRTAAPASTVLGMSLPIASALTAQEQAGGSAVDASGYGMAILGDAANGRVYFLDSTCPVAGNDFYGFSFMYLIQ